MLHRFIRAAIASTQQKAKWLTAQSVFARSTIGGFLATAHHLLMVLGIIAISVLAILFFKPDLADKLQAVSPFAVETAEDIQSIASSDLKSTDVPANSSIVPIAAYSTNSVAPYKEEKNPVNLQQQQWVTSWLSKRYRVAADATNMLVAAAYITAKETKLDPLLILSVMAIESGFNPFAESPVGAQGLMQVMSKVHHDKFKELGGIKAALNPLANIKVGSLILKDYVTRGGSIEAGLKLYVGAGALESDSGYGAKVLAEYYRLKEVAMGKNVPIYTTTVSATPSKPQQQPQPQKTENLHIEFNPAPESEQQTVTTDQVAAI